MTSRLLTQLFITCLCVGLWSGCGGTSTGGPLKVADIPTALTNVFESSGTNVKAIANRAAFSIQSKNFPLAYHDLETLKLMPDLTEEQKALVKRAMLTVAP